MSAFIDRLLLSIRCTERDLLIGNGLDLMAGDDRRVCTEKEDVTGHRRAAVIIVRKIIVL